MALTDRSEHHVSENISFGDATHAAALAVTNQAGRSLSMNDLTGESRGSLLPTYQMDHKGITFTTLADNDRATPPADQTEGKQTCPPKAGGDWLGDWIADNVPILGSPGKVAKTAAEATAKPTCDK